MTGPTTLAIWSTIIGLGIATYLVRFSFLGLLGDWRPPEWAERMLRYLPMAMIPALAAPMVVFPKEAETGDPLRLGCAMLALAAGLATRSLLAAMATGLGAFFGAQALGF